MTPPAPLTPDQLYTPCDVAQFVFDTTSELDDLTEIIGQTRALEAVRFGVGMRREGYNLYVMGPPGMGKHSLVRQSLGEKAAQLPTPDDWCYVHNFEQPHRPKALRLPPGWGARLRLDISHFIEELAAALPAAFDGEEYRAGIEAMEGALKEREQHAFDALAADALAHDVKLFRTPSGFAFAPLRNNEALSPAEYETLPQEEQQRLERLIGGFQERLREVLEHIPQWRRETREEVKQLNRKTARGVVDQLLVDLKRTYNPFPALLAHLEEIRDDVLENIKDFVKTEESEGEVHPSTLHRYQVNLLVDNSQTRGAPVIYLDHPTFMNLVGRAEHLAQMGTLITDFTLLKSGALHQANGGYLMVDAHKLLTQPFAWDGLKRTLYAHQVRIESLEKMVSLVSTVSLEPEPIPLDLKVVLLGDRFIYYLLHEYDPDFAELFKVAADFEEEIPRAQESALLYARLIATLARKEGLKPFDRQAVARVVEHGARLAEDADRLTTHMRSIADLVREADYWGSESGHPIILAADVQRAIDKQSYRNSRLREHLQEEIERGAILIATQGGGVGQINALSVLELGGYRFGHPTRITATVHIGDGDVVDIEREVELGGPLHSKGVLILSGFISSRYARHHPLSLSAHLVFEQSYGGVEGDSASLAELVALLSAIAELPIRQELAITGSVNQKGEVQPIGGVNEKVEGFFDLCAARGLTGQQGVIIPYANLRHLMLKASVVEAVRAGQFALYAVQRVDEALALLLAMEPGEPDSEGLWPTESINGRIQQQLTEMSLIKQRFGERDHRDEEQEEGLAAEGERG